MNAQAEVVDGDVEIEGTDPDRGRLFDVPRVGVIVDSSDPTVIKLAFSGSIELDRTHARQVEFYNDLAAGRASELVVSVHVAGARKIHRRDNEGDVDAIVETKSILVTDVHFQIPGEE